MEQILKVGDVIEFNGKRYRAESKPASRDCGGCVFGDARSCPIQEDCGTNNVILKEVKENPRHIELGVVKVEGDNVTFRIVEQTHRGKNFSQQICKNIFKASNGIELGSIGGPAWKDDKSRLFCRGNICDNDNSEITCTVTEFAKISEAITEYNAADGKGYEKPWPITCDSYYYVNENCTVGCNTFNACDYDCELQKIGNCFRTSEEAVAAAEKVKALFKELAGRAK